MPWRRRFFLILGGTPRFYPNFTDKPAFSSDLSVNFCPLWWWFTDKILFSEHLSVKPGPKRLNFYGQTAFFAHFVRNRYFSSRPFTDRSPIFIDVSVNDNWFCQMQCCTSSAPWPHPSLGGSGRQKSHISPGFCLLFLEIQSGLRAKSRFLRFARNRKDDSRILLSQMD